MMEHSFWETVVLLQDWADAGKGHINEATGWNGVPAIDSPRTPLRQQ
jgi:hypothetical protein